MIQRIITVITLVWLTGCQSDSGDSASGTTETNWLKRCDDTSECGVGACACGLCTFECSVPSDCSGAPEAARCATDGDGAYDEACGAQAVSGICVRAEGATSTGDDDSTDDDQGADDTTSDDTNDDDSDAADDDATSADDDTSNPDDDDAAADDDATSMDDDATPDDSATDDDVQGTAGKGAGGAPDGAGGSAAAGASSGGAGGASSTPQCDPGCRSVCAGGVCGCTCESAAAWAACEVPSDCVLAPAECCSCSRFEAVNAEHVSEHLDAVCPNNDELDCDECLPVPDPYGMTACIEGLCSVVHLDETPITECEMDADCTLTEPMCCASCTQIEAPEEQLISIDTSRGLEVQQLFCDTEQACPPCVTTIPDSASAKCNQGRCTVAVESTSTDSECPAPDGTDVPVTVHDAATPGGFQCESGMVFSTSITSQEQLDEFAMLCGTPVLVNSPLVPPEVDFESQLLVAVVGFQTLSVSFAYAVQLEDGIHIGATREQYCGGAAPPDSVVFVVMETPAVPVVHDSCTIGQCSGPLPP